MLSSIYICLYSFVVRKLVPPKFNRTINDYFTLYRSDIVQKLVPPKFKRTMNNYFTLYRSGHVMQIWKYLAVLLKYAASDVK